MFTPNTVVRLLENVDITNSYVNTFSFSTKSEQASFFINKTKFAFTDLTHQRTNGKVRLEVNIESLWNVSYMMFQNSNFGTKWFYAFITNMKYINDYTTEIDFEIDVMQTWLFDTDIKDCYIEREHVSNDTIGKHLLDENLDIGDPIVKESSTSISIEDLTYVLVTSVDENLQQVQGDVYTGVYNGLAFYASDDITYLNNVIDILDTDGKANALVAIFTMPKNLVHTISDTDRKVQPSDSSWFELDGVDKPYDNLDGYIPKNNKMFVYPYNYLEVTDHKGNNRIYKYEYFSDPIACQFFMTCNVAPNPTVFLTPYDYNNIYQNAQESMSLSDYPLCAWNSDVYANWLAQNQVSNAVKVGGSLLSLGVGIATANPIAIGGGVLGVASSIGSFKDVSVRPPEQKGSMSGGGNVARGTQTFGFLKKTVRYAYARIIDNYFSRFGYKVNEVKTPNLKSRQNWNYIKMHEVNIFGNIPNQHMKKIHSIYKEGITFWHSDNVGNYSLSNPII